MKKRDYERALHAVREVVHRWDPYGLLAGGGPTGEFDREIASIAKQVPRIRSPIDAAHVLSRVFSSAFDPTQFGLDECADAGVQLYKALSKTFPEDASRLSAFTRNQSKRSCRSSRNMQPAQ